MMTEIIYLPGTANRHWKKSHLRTQIQAYSCTALCQSPLLHTTTLFCFGGGIQCAICFACYGVFTRFLVFGGHCSLSHADLLTNGADYAFWINRTFSAVEPRNSSAWSLVSLFV
jgi:hypothetical protein